MAVICQLFIASNRMLFLSTRPTQGGSEELFEIMQKCHNYKAEERPTFAEILEILDIDD